jgi:hypothetical protein
MPQPWCDRGVLGSSAQLPLTSASTPVTIAPRVPRNLRKRTLGNRFPPCGGDAGVNVCTALARQAATCACLSNSIAIGRSQTSLVKMVAHRHQ